MDKDQTFDRRSTSALLDQPKITARGVGRAFRVRAGRYLTAVDGLDLEIADGEFVSLVGPSGCGKSTFLRILAGLARPTAGTVEMVHRDRGRPLTATVFQEYSVYPWRTVTANVRFGLDLAGRPRRAADETAAYWIDRMGLQGFEKNFPRTLSGGMKQRVALARAFAVEPEILLMDEPFAALDAQLRKVLQNELLALWEEERRTVVFVTHSLEEAILLSDRVVLMTARPGRIKDVYDIPFPRPRPPEIRATAEFAELEARIWSSLEAEVMAATEEARPMNPSDDGGPESD